MSGFSAIDLSKLPAPDAVEVLSVEVILAALKADAIARDPELAEALSLESEPMTKLLEVVAFRELLLRQRINEAARATMLAFAAGADLDHIGALFGVERAVVFPGFPDQFPPVLEVLEGDVRFRGRIQLSLEGFSTAGTFGGYRFFALSASGAIADVAVLNPAPGVVRVVILDVDGDGAADAALIATVQSALDADTVRPLCDTVDVVSATIVPFSIDATLTFFDGPDPAVVMTAARAAVDEFVAAQRLVGRDIPRAGIIAALYRSGVQNVALVSPAADVVIADDAAAFCNAISIVSGGLGD